MFTASYNTVKWSVKNYKKTTAPNNEEKRGHRN